MNQKTFLRHSIVFTAIYFFSINGLAALPNLSVSFLLKEKIGLSASELAYFHAVTILAWVVKPFWGFISDSFPIFGYRRKSYLILSSVLAGLMWISLGLVQNYSAGLLLGFITISYMAYAFQDVVADGLMVEVGKPYNLTGKFQSVQWSSVYLAMVITAFLGGYLSDLTRKGIVSYQHLFLTVAVSAFVITVVSIFFVQEEKKPLEKDEINLKDALTSKSLWLLAFFMFLWKFSPSVNAPFFYYAVDTLKFDGSFIGLLQGTAAIAGLIGAVIYGKYLTEVSIRKFLIIAVLLSALTTLFDFIYFIPSLVANPEILKKIAFVTRIPFGMIETVIHLTILNLAAKTSPRFAGGTVFALLMSFSNLGMMGSDILGGMLFPLLGLKPLILVSALFTLFVLPLIPILKTNQKAI